MKNTSSTIKLKVEAQVFFGDLLALEKDNKSVALWRAGAFPIGIAAYTMNIGDVIEYDASGANEKDIIVRRELGT